MSTPDLIDFAGFQQKILTYSRGNPDILSIKLLLEQFFLSLHRKFSNLNISIKQLQEEKLQYTKFIELFKKVELNYNNLLEINSNHEFSINLLNEQLIGRNCKTR